MSQEATTVARPYAKAIFWRAQATDAFDDWSLMLESLDRNLNTGKAKQLLSHPKITKSQREDILLELYKDFSDEGKNLLRLLNENARLDIASEIRSSFEQLKNDQLGVLDVTLTSAYKISEDQQHRIAEALKRILECEVNITAQENKELIGGLHIRAGDIVIESSMREQLQLLANELGI